jgi:hypothetical protein
VAVESLTVDRCGIWGDRHYGKYRRSGARDRPLGIPSGLAIPNDRMGSAGTTDELAMMGQRLSGAVVQPERMGFNIIVRGCGPITQLPPGTRFCWGCGLELVVAAENLPCGAMGGEVSRSLVGVSRAQAVAAAADLRGIVGPFRLVAGLEHVTVRVGQEVMVLDPLPA